MWMEYKDQGLMVVTLAVENSASLTPSQVDLNAWAVQLGQTFPVLSDAELVGARFTENGFLPSPSHTLLGPGAVVIVADGDVEESDILAALP